MNDEGLCMACLDYRGLDSKHPVRNDRDTLTERIRELEEENTFLKEHITLCEKQYEEFRSNIQKEHDTQVEKFKSSLDEIKSSFSAYGPGPSQEYVESVKALVDQKVQQVDQLERDIQAEKKQTIPKLVYIPKKPAPIKRPSVKKDSRWK